MMLVVKNSRMGGPTSSANAALPHGFWSPSDARILFRGPGWGRITKDGSRSLYITGNALAKIAFGGSFKNIFSVYGHQAVEICTEMSTTFTGAASAHHAAADQLCPRVTRSGRGQTFFQ